jgi:uncharacterized NAD(P)/FAD-binding protein YdhS
LLVAVQLLRNGFRGKIDIIEPRERLGTGLAYSTPFDQHLLNVPAGKISALAGQPAHFLEWLRAHHLPDAEPDTFAPRKIYGEYLQDLLTRTVSACRHADLSHIRAEVVSIASGATNGDAGGSRLTLSDGTVIYAERTVLALGNPASSPEPGSSRNGIESRWHLSPWFGDALKVRFPGERILVLGTGLTAVDCVLALLGGTPGCEIVMLSRRGILPRVHDLQAAAPKPPILKSAGNLRSIVRELRDNVDAARQSDLCWRGVVDALRPVSNDLWCNLSCDDKTKFQRHLKTYWEVHRHRMAPRIQAQLDEYQSRGAVQVLAGRIRKVHSHGDISTVRVLLKQGGECELNANRIISCNGIHENYAGAARPLIRQLIQDGLARANDLGIGFHTDRHGALIGKDLRPSPVLFTLGPPRRGQLFETTAVPEIRVQADELAVYLLRSQYAWA